MVVETVKEGNSTKEDNKLESGLTNDIFDEYDDIFKALVGN